MISSNIASSLPEPSNPSLVSWDTRAPLNVQYHKHPEHFGATILLVSAWGTYAFSTKELADYAITLQYLQACSTAHVDN